MTVESLKFIDEQLSQVFQRKVRLPGGGEIVIDETEKDMLISFR